MIDPADLKWMGSGLTRPECAIAHQSGLVVVPDWSGDGGVSLLRPDGSTTRLLARHTSRPYRPNGIALEAGGSILFAQLDDQNGGLYRLFPDGTVEAVLKEVGGRALPPSNFPLIDHQGRTWLTISTRVKPRCNDYRPDASSGFIVLIDDKGARVVADGLGFTNECAVSMDGGTLWVNETFVRRTTAFDIAADGSLKNKRVVAKWGYGTYPGGLAVDEQGGLWVTSIVSNRVIRLDPDGSQDLILEDCDETYVEWAEYAWKAMRLDRAHLGQNTAKTLKNISNLAFSGPDLKTAVLGCLHGHSIATFETDVAGVAPSHWGVELGALALC